MSEFIRIGKNIAGVSQSVYIIAESPPTITRILIKL